MGKKKKKTRRTKAKAVNANSAIKMAFLGVAIFAIIVGYSAYTFLGLLNDANASQQHINVLRQGLALAVPGALGAAFLAGVFLLLHLLMEKGRGGM